MNLSSVASPVYETTVPGDAGAEDPSLETALTAVEMRLAVAMRSAAALARELRSAKDAARVGHCRGLTDAISRASSGVDALVGKVQALRASWSFDPTAYLGEGHFSAEVKAAASSVGIRTELFGERLVAFPSVIRVRPELAAVEIDGRRETGLRAANIIAALGTSRKRVTRFRAEPFLEALESAYLRLSPERMEGRIVRLTDIWQLFTLLPGSASEYSPAEFGRDLNLLDESGLSITRAGRRLAFAASSGSRVDSTFTGIDRNGRPHLYWGVSFS